MTHATPNQSHQDEWWWGAWTRGREGEENRFSLSQDGRFWNMAAPHGNGLTLLRCTLKHSGNACCGGTHTLTVSTQEAEAQGVLAYIVGGQLGLHNETLA